MLSSLMWTVFQCDMIIHNSLRYIHTICNNVIPWFWVYPLSEYTACTHTCDTFFILFYQLHSLSFQWWWYVFKKTVVKVASDVISLFLSVNLCLLFPLLFHSSVFFIWLWSYVCVLIQGRVNDISWISLVQFSFYILSSHLYRFLAFIQSVFTFVCWKRSRFSAMESILVNKIFLEL